MKKLTKKGMALAAASAILMGTAFASRVDAQSVSADPDYLEKGTINKYLVIPDSAKVPATKVEFEITPIAADIPATATTNAIYAGVGKPKINPAVFNAGQDATDTDDDTTTAATVGVVSDSQYAVSSATYDFSKVIFPRPGIYRYLVTETSLSTSEVNSISYTQEPLYLDVYVENDGDTFGIKHFILHKTDLIPEKGSGEYTEKTDGFVNTMDARNLTIEKDVTGNMGDKDKEFTFYISFENYELDLTQDQNDDGDIVFYVQAYDHYTEEITDFNPADFVIDNSNEWNYFNSPGPYLKYNLYKVENGSKTFVAQSTDLLTSDDWKSTGSVGQYKYSFDVDGYDPGDTYVIEVSNKNDPYGQLYFNNSVNSSHMSLDVEDIPVQEGRADGKVSLDTSTIVADAGFTIFDIFGGTTVDAAEIDLSIYNSQSNTVFTKVKEETTADGKTVTTWSFKLKDGESVNIDIPKNTKYTVWEERDPDYVVSTSSTDTSDTTTLYDDKVEGTLGQDTEVTFTNDKSVTTPTGIFFGNYYWIVFPVAAVAVGFIIRKIRKGRESCDEED